MKKEKTLSVLSLAALMLLSSCGGNGGDGSGSQKQSESEDAPTSDYAMENSAEGIIQALKTMKEGFNYTLHNSYDDSEYQFNKKFYTTSAGSKKKYYANLPYHKDATKNVSYVVTFPRTGDPYVSALAYVQDVYGDRSMVEFSSYNFLSSFPDETEASSFKEYDGYYNTDDAGVLAPFISLYGTSSIAQISFWVDNGGKNLNYELFSSSGLSLTTGYLFHIGNTRDASMEKLVSGFSWEEQGKALTKEQAGTIFDANFSGTTDVYLDFLSSSNRIASIDFKCNADTLYIKATNDPDNGGKVYMNYIKERESDGRALSYGLTAQNEPTSTETRFFFSQYTLPADLDINDFRLCGDGVYRYFSIEPGDIYQTFSHVSINDENCEFSEVTLQLENDKVVSITSESNPTTSGVYKAVTKFKAYDGIELPTAYQEEGPAAIVRAMNYFDGAYEHPFEVVKVNSLTNPTQRQTYTFDGTTYLIQNESYDSYTSSWSNSIKGYTVNDKDQVVAFRQIQGKDKLVQSEEIIEGDKITNYFPKLIDPKTVAKNADDTYSFKELVTDASSSLWLTGTTVANTVTMTTNSRGLLSSMKGQVSYTASGAEYLTFSYDNIALPENIDVSNIGPMELTCYADDTPDEWADLVNYIGEDYASLIPYYYDKKHVGNWFAEPCYSSGTGVPDGGLSYDEAPLIGVSFYCFGSDVETSVLDEGFEKNGFTKITTGEMLDIGYRDDDYIKNGRDTDVYEIDTSTQTVWVLEGKLRVVYVNEIPYHHFSPSYNGKVTLGGDSSGVLDDSTLSSSSRSVEYTLHSGILIQKIDGTEINRKGTFH